MTSIGFVSTSVLESKDGIDFGDEKRLETEEVKEAEKRALEAARRPLWEQLQEREEAKAEKYDEVRKAIFAPPKGLDEEDVTFLQSVEEARRAAKKTEKHREVLEIEAFASARANQIVAAAHEMRAVRHVVAAPKSEDARGGGAVAAAAPVIVKRKKEKDGGHAKKKAKKAKSASAPAPAVPPPAAAGPVASDHGSANDGGGLGGLVAYGSEDSDA
ncbi:hypothetical protein JKP88DRAFT_45747 [Tribonema minus]|uniref:FAM192A/Fyv6 N-terminal domain-containing protein n=1 Tax=Tribonema minus TaxID=303371 RepID=A0A835Z9S0_9STRA|nr:hypothetical protein JKP88DRAFT_45747 [Tribonema minus]